MTGAQDRDNPALYFNHTCGVRAFWEPPEKPSNEPKSKKVRIEAPGAVIEAQREARAKSAVAASTSGRSAAPSTNPIDHIFQFHKVLFSICRGLLMASAVQQVDLQIQLHCVFF